MNHTELNLELAQLLLDYHNHSIRQPMSDTWLSLHLRFKDLENKIVAQANKGEDHAG